MVRSNNEAHADDVWEGSGYENWSTVFNWSDGAPSAGADIDFGSGFYPRVNSNGFEGGIELADNYSVSLSSITFLQGAPSMTNYVGLNAGSSTPTTLDIIGSGISNISGNPQVINNYGYDAVLNFTNTAAANGVVLVNENGEVGAASNAIYFSDSSSAGSSVIYNQPEVESDPQAIIYFQDTSTAANSSITNEGSPNVSGGEIIFENNLHC